MKILSAVIKQLIWGALTISMTLYAEVPNTVHGVAITPSTVLQLAPKVPHQVRQEIDAWLSYDQTRELLKKLIALPRVSDWQQDRDEALSLLAASGYKNMSAENYTAPIPGTDYLFKIDGQKDRVISMLATKGLILDVEQQKDETVNRLVNEHLTSVLPTYQTASRIAYYLLLKDCRRKRKYRHIDVPESYLVRLPGKPYAAQDGNVMLIQKMIPGAQKLAGDSERIRRLPAETVAELYDIVVDLGVWNIRNNILIKENDAVCLTCSVGLGGFVQPKDSSATDFFHKSKQRFDESVYIGLQGLLDLFKDDKQKSMYLRDRIRTDKRLKQSHYYDALKKLVQD